MLFAIIFVLFEWCIVLPAFSLSTCDAKFASDGRSPAETAANEYIRAYVPIKLPRLMATTSNDGNIGQLMALEFAASDNRDFRISLRPIVGVVSSATNVSTVSPHDGVRTPFDVTRFAGWKHYEGRLDDDPRSLVAGHAIDGLFTGFVNTDNETYYLEPSGAYFPVTSRRKYNAILYKASDVYICPSSPNSTSSSEQRDDVDCVRPAGLRRVHSILPVSLLRELMAINPFGQNVRRARRRTDFDGNKLKATTFLCDLRVICDFRWYRYVAFRNTTYGTELVVSLLRRVDQMFRSLDLDGDGRPENVGFFLRYLDIYIDPVLPGYEDIEHWHAPRFFEEFGAYDFGDVCAGLLLTYRQLSHADQTGSWHSEVPTVPKTNIDSLEQGICSLYVPPKGPTQSQHDYGDYVANALPVNFMSLNRVASASSIVIETAHQLGHLFGARDDADMADARCHPDDNDLTRNYVMAYPLVSGDAERNFLWSPCSQVAIETFLRGLEQEERPCLKPCHDPVSCLTDRWSTGSANGDDQQHHGLGLRPRESNEFKKKDLRDAGLDSNETTSTVDVTAVKVEANSEAITTDILIAAAPTTTEQTQGGVGKSSTTSRYFVIVVTVITVSVAAFASGISA